MDISGYYARISDDQRQINFLEEECKCLKRNIDRMYDEEYQHCKSAESFRNMLAAEQSNVSQIKLLENIHIAQACAEDINYLVTGSKANFAMDGLEKISLIFKRRIEESEESLREKRRKISSLHDDIAFCYREIGRLEEEARQEAARQAAMQNSKY